MCCITLKNKKRAGWTAVIAPADSVRSLRPGGGNHATADHHLEIILNFNTTYSWLVRPSSEICTGCYADEKQTHFKIKNISKCWAGYS